MRSFQFISKVDLAVEFWGNPEIQNILNIMFNQQSHPANVIGLVSSNAVF
jgi:hypothetical protein